MKKAEGLMYRTARISYITNYILATFILLLLIIFEYYLGAGVPSWMTVFIIVVILFFIEEPEIERIIRQYNITNREIMMMEGIISKKRVIIPHHSISDINVKKSVLGRILNYGDIEVGSTSGREHMIIKMKGMKDPDEIYRILDQKIRSSAKREHKRPVTEDFEE